MIFKRSDFEFTYPAGVKFLGNYYKFDRPARLTKWDIACVLDTLQRHMHWLFIYDSFRYSDLCLILNSVFEDYEK